MSRAGARRSRRRLRWGKGMHKFKVAFTNLRSLGGALVENAIIDAESFRVEVIRVFKMVQPRVDICYATEGKGEHCGRSNAGEGRTTFAASLKHGLAQDNYSFITIKRCVNADEVIEESAIVRLHGSGLLKGHNRFLQLPSRE